MSMSKPRGSKKRMCVLRGTGLMGLFRSVEEYKRRIYTAMRQRIVACGARRRRRRWRRGHVRTMYAGVCHVLKGGRKASGFESIALTDGTGLVMGREQGFRGVGRGGLEPDKRLRRGSRARLG